MTNANAEVRTIEERLAEACQQAGLDGKVLDRTGGVQVSSPGAHSRLTETVTCGPDEAKRLMFWWSWGDSICPATDITDAVQAIMRVVTPSVRS